MPSLGTILDVTLQFLKLGTQVGPFGLTAAARQVFSLGRGHVGIQTIL